MAFYNRGKDRFGSAKPVCVINPTHQSARFRDDTHKILSAVAFHCESGYDYNPHGRDVRYEPTKISELEETITAKIKQVADETNRSKFSL